MFAQLVKDKSWKDGTSTATVSLVMSCCHPDDKSEQRQFQHETMNLLAKTLAGLVGNEYAHKLVYRDELCHITSIDLSGVLTLLKEFKEKEGSKNLSQAWVTNWLKRRVRPEWLHSSKKELVTAFTCRCGTAFKGKNLKKLESKFRRHQRRCIVLKELDPLFKRCKTVLGEIDGKSKHKLDDKKSARKAKGSRPKETSKKDKAMVRGTKVRRTKRNSGKGSKRKV